MEFTPREKLRPQQVMGMMSGGEHDQPIVTWPDDTSMVLCTFKSLIECGIDYTDQMSRFEESVWRGSSTAHNEVFGVDGSVKLKDRFFALPGEDCFRMR